MSNNFNTNTGNNDEWLTPPYIIETLGPFDLDPCAPKIRPWAMAKLHYSKNEDGLSRPWKGRVWLNPPYGRETFFWLAKLSEHKSGIALIFARTETKGFHEQIWEKARAVMFFRGRLSFHYVTGQRGNTANAPSCLVTYSNQDTEKLAEAIRNKLINGKLVLLNGVK